MQRYIRDEKCTEIISGSALRLDTHERVAKLYSVDTDLPILEVKAGAEVAILTGITNIVLKNRVYFQIKNQDPNFCSP
jgi:hypothetical protein